MKQQVINNDSTRDTQILTTMFDSEVTNMMTSERLFKAAMAEIQARIIAKVADIVEPRIVEHIMTLVDIPALVDEAVRAQVRAALFPVKEKPSAPPQAPPR